MSFALYSMLMYSGTCQEVCSTACVVKEVTGTTDGQDVSLADWRWFEVGRRVRMLRRGLWDLPKMMVIVSA